MYCILSIFKRNLMKIEKSDKHFFDIAIVFYKVYTVCAIADIIYPARKNSSGPVQDYLCLYSMHLFAGNPKMITK